MNTFYLEGPGGIPGLQQTPANGQAHTKRQIAFDGGVSFGGFSTGNALVTAGNTPPVVASAATVAFAPTSFVSQHTPTQNETINFAAPGAYGVEIFLEVITSGASSFTLTFGTNTKNQGTLATGTTTAKTFIVAFVSDGTNWVETGRTSAM